MLNGGKSLLFIFIFTKHSFFLVPGIGRVAGCDLHPSPPRSHNAAPSSSALSPRSRRAPPEPPRRHRCSPAGPRRSHREKKENRKKKIEKKK